MPKATNSSSTPDLLKAPAIRSDKTIRRKEVDQEDRKTKVGLSNTLPTAERRLAVQ